MSNETRTFGGDRQVRDYFEYILCARTP